MCLPQLYFWILLLKENYYSKEICCVLIQSLPLFVLLFQINVLKSIEDLDKADLLRILDFIENTLKVHWQDHEGFVALQERVLALRMILEEAGEKPLEGMSCACL